MSQLSPQSRNLLTLVALLGVAGALGAYAWFGVIQADEKEAEQKAAQEKLFAARGAGEKTEDGGELPPPEWRQLTVTAKGDTTVLEKRDGKWWVTSPVTSLADEPTVNTVLGQLNSAKVKSTVEEQPTPADLAKYGLEQPRFSVKGKAHVPAPKGAGGGTEKEVSLQGGIENTFDGSVYLRKGEDPKVYSVDGWVRGALEKSTFELRDKQVVALEEGKLARVEVKSRANAYTLERDAQKAWRVVKPVALLAEPATLTSMLSGLGGERALSFPKDSPEERKRLGLEAPALDATFTPEGGGAVRLRLSKVTEGGSEKAYALREDAGGALLAEVPVSALGHLDKKAAELRDRTVLAFDKGLVHRLGFTQAGGGAEVVVEKAESPDAGGDDWKVAAPEKGSAKKWKMSSVVWTLGSLKAAAFGEKPKDWAKYGIDGRSRAATVYDAQGRVLARLQVGKDVPGKPGTVYARGTQDTVLELETQRLAELPTTVEDVLDRPSAPTAATEGQDGGMSGANTGGTPFGGPLQQ